MIYQVKIDERVDCILQKKSAFCWVNHFQSQHGENVLFVQQSNDTNMCEMILAEGGHWQTLQIKMRKKTNYTQTVDSLSTEAIQTWKSSE